jgi:hypothetical protein
MTTEHESYCCTESENVRNLKDGLTCITHHESFPSVILNKDTLQAARYQMMLHAKAIYIYQAMTLTLRYGMAYHSLTTLLHQHLVKKIEIH